ncbi:hypothetical protein CH063_13036, partial [Colletotrichum higginsianum]
SKPTRAPVAVLGLPGRPIISGIPSRRGGREGCEQVPGLQTGHGSTAPAVLHRESAGESTCGTVGPIFVPGRPPSHVWKWKSGKSLICLVSNLRRLESDELVFSWIPRGLKNQAQKARLRGVARCSELELRWPELGWCWLGGLDRVNG